MYKQVLILIFLLMSLSAANIHTDTPKREKVVSIVTPYGKMMVKLYNETPQHRDNFIKLVNENFYDSLLFHRVIENFMIQGGDPESKNAKPGKALGNGGLDYTIPAEFNPNLFHKKGVIAAAREGDNVNPEKASSSCQFYLVQGKVFTRDELLTLQEKKIAFNKQKAVRDLLASPDQKELKKARNDAQNDMNVEALDSINLKIDSIIAPELEKYKFSEEQIEAYTTIGGTPHLDGDYTVFGEVIEGFDVIDSIAAVQTDRRDRPRTDVPFSIKKGK